MTPDIARQATLEAVRAAEELAARMAHVLPTSPDAIAAWGDEPWERLHAFHRMFEQLFDLTSRKLFRGLLALSGEPIAGMSARNQFRRVEAIGGIASADRWVEIGSTRNILAHDYPTDPVAQVQRANRAWQDHSDLIATTRQAIAFLRAEVL